MITYSKNINQVECYKQIDEQSDVVTTVSWTLTGVDGNFSAGIQCSTPVPYTIGQEITPYRELTEEQMMAWIEEFTDPVMMASYEKWVADNIEQQQALYSPTLPWQEDLTSK